MNTYHKRHIEHNQHYKQHEHTIDSIQSALKREIPHLIQEFQLTALEVSSLNEFMDDRATLFRFLRKNNYSLPTSLSLLLDTVRWRILIDINDIRISTTQHFLEHPFVYFHKVDQVGRPVLIVNLAQLPKAPGDVTEFLTPLVIFVLETARQLTWDITKGRMASGVENPLVLDTMVLVEFKNAASLPTDIGLMKSFVTLLRRYPGLTGTVNLLNFGWMYQGLWQMCKLVLSEDAKSKVNFPKLKELKSMIPEKDLLKEFGGQDEFVWTLAEDPYYTKYRNNTVSMSPRLSRRNSNVSVYYDTMEPLLTRPASSTSLYATPISSLTPVASHANLTQLARAYSSLSLNSKIGNGIPPRFRHTIKTLGDLLVTPATPNHDLIGGVPSWVLSEKLDSLQRQDTYLPNNNDDNNNRKPWLLCIILKCENRARLFTLGLLKRMMKYKSTLYWLVICILLRNGVQELLHQVVMLIMQVALNTNPSTGMRHLLSLTTGQLTL